MTPRLISLLACLVFFLGPARGASFLDQLATDSLEAAGHVGDLVSASAPRTNLFTASQAAAAKASASKISQFSNSLEVAKALQKDGALSAIGTGAAIAAAEYAGRIVTADFGALATAATANPVLGALIGATAGAMAKIVVKETLLAFGKGIAGVLAELMSIDEYLDDIPAPAAPPPSFDDQLSRLSRSHQSHLDQIAASAQNPALGVTADQLSAAARAQQARNQAALNQSILSGGQALADQVATTRASSTGSTPSSAPGLTSEHIPPTRAQLEREISDLDQVIAQLDDNLRRQRGAGNPLPEITRQLEQNRAAAVRERNRLVALRPRY